MPDSRRIASAPTTGTSIASNARSALALAARWLLALAAALALAPAGAPAAGDGLLWMLARPAEAHGLTIRGRPRQSRSLRRFVAGNQDPGILARRLRSWGFEAWASELLRGPGGEQAVSSVVELRSARGAALFTRYSVWQLRHQGRGVYRPLRVPGVPGAVGYAFTLPRSAGGDVNIYWVQGRCQLLVGASRTGAPPPLGPLVSAVEAIHRRTGSRCP